MAASASHSHQTVQSLLRPIKQVSPFFPIDLLFTNNQLNNHSLSTHQGACSSQQLCSFDPMPMVKYNAGEMHLSSQCINIPATKIEKQ